MKTVIKNRYTPRYSKCAVWLCWSLFTGLLAIAQTKVQQVPGFGIVSRQLLSAENTGGPSLSGSNVLTIKSEGNEEKRLYRIGGHGIQATVPALSCVEVAKGGGRIWVYGDSAYRHSATNGYANVYTATGSLIKSLGLLGTKPYVAAVADNGSMAFAGNVGKAGESSYMLTLFDANGNKRWDAQLPAAWPSEVYLSDDNQYVAVSLYFPEEYTNKVLVYDAAGRLLYTHRGSVSGIAFLPSRKMVACEGSGWSVYDIGAGFTRLYTGTLPGVPVGRFPVAGHPAADIFFILSLNASKQLSLQAYDARTGAMVAQGEFAGKGYRQPYRQLETMKDGSIQVSTETEVITLRMK